MRNDPKIDQQLVDLLFPNLESITQWHKELSADFKVRRKEQPVVQEIGDILINRVGVLKSSVVGVLHGTYDT